MPAPHTHTPATQRRTLAEKLKRLRDMKTPPGQPPPSYEITARQITHTTGVSISGPYFWELVTGRTTNPKLHHLQALARYYHVPVAYLADDHTDHHQLESELQLLHTLKHNGTHTIELQATDDPDTDLATIQHLLLRLAALDDFGDEETREAALRLSALESPERTELLEALRNADVRALARTADQLNDDRRATAGIALGEPDLLDALADETVRCAAVRIAQLSPSSRRAILSLTDHLCELERSAGA